MFWTAKLGAWLSSIGTGAILPHPVLPDIEAKEVKPHVLPQWGSTLSPSTWGPGVDISHDLCYYLTWLDTQLSKFGAVLGYGNPRPPNLCRPSPGLLRFRANRSHPARAPDQALPGQISGSTRFQWVLWQRLQPAPARQVKREPIAHPSAKTRLYAKMA